MKKIDLFELLFDAVGVLWSNWFKVLIGSLCVLTIAGILGVFFNSLFVFMLVYGAMSVALYNYIVSTVLGEAQLEELFNKKYYTINSVVLGCVVALLYTLGLYLFIAPSILVFIFLGLSIPIFAEKGGNTFDVLETSRNIVKGNRLRLLLFSLILLAVLAAVVGIVMFFVWIYSLIFTMVYPVWLVALVIGALVYLLFFVPVIMLSLKYLYNECLRTQEADETSNQEVEIEVEVKND